MATTNVPDHVRKDGPAAAAVERDAVCARREPADVRVVLGVRHAPVAVGRHIVHEAVPVLSRAEPQQQHHRVPEGAEVGLRRHGAFEADLHLHFLEGTGESGGEGGRDEVCPQLVSRA